jgi:hypothetical protein
MVLSVNNSAGALVPGASSSKGGVVMKIKIVSPCWIGGKPYKVGDIVTVTDPVGREVIGTTRGVLVPAGSDVIPAEGKKTKKGKE